MNIHQKFIPEERLKMNEPYVAVIPEEQGKRKKQHWQSYCDGHNCTAKMPEYLAKNYWWAYLSPIGVFCFDLPFIVNRILWGQYNKIANDVVDLLATESDYSLAQISCAYGEIIPKVGAGSNSSGIYLFDVAAIQLKQAGKKIRANNTEKAFSIFEANAENIPLPDNSVDTSLLFFLLHELPENVRKDVLKESLRITKPGGRIVIADYGPATTTHWFHKLTIFRKTFEKLEPFLGNFWRSDLHEELEVAARIKNKGVTKGNESYYWHRFYRVVDFSVGKSVISLFGN